MIIGSSTSVLINKGVIEEIGVATPIGKGKEKKAKFLRPRKVLRVLKLAKIPRKERML